VAEAPELLDKYSRTLRCYLFPDGQTCGEMIDHFNWLKYAKRAERVRFWGFSNERIHFVSLRRALLSIAILAAAVLLAVPCLDGSLSTHSWVAAGVILFTTAGLSWWLVANRAWRRPAILIWSVPWAVSFYLLAGLDSPTVWRRALFALWGLLVGLFINSWINRSNGLLALEETHPALEHPEAQGLREAVEVRMRGDVPVPRTWREAAWAAMARQVEIPTLDRSLELLDDGFKVGYVLREAVVEQGFGVDLAPDFAAALRGRQKSPSVAIAEMVDAMLPEFQGVEIDIGPWWEFEGWLRSVYEPWSAEVSERQGIPAPQWADLRTAVVVGYTTRTCLEVVE
jgi:hypothetical protein